MAVKHPKEKIEEYEMNLDAMAGVAIRDLSSSDSKEEHDVYSAHRDNHFILIFAIGGILRIIIDFEEKLLVTPAILIITPGQVHHILESSYLSGWAISFDPVLMDEGLRYVYEESMSWPLSIDKGGVLFWQTESLMMLINQVISTKDTGRFGIQATHHLLSALLNTIVMASSGPLPSNKEKENRGNIIEQNFKRLLRDHYKDWKQPSRYASELSVSVSHLNDTIKEITGKSISLHIQQRSILEAKRLLHSSNLSIKEVSYEVGYEDPVYFGKLFRKIAGYSPLQFRSKFRD